MDSIYIGADHRGYKLKEKLIDILKKENYAVVDVGNTKYDPEDDFPDYAMKLGEEVVANKSRGILVCGSGVGMSLAVNKVKGVRAGLCTTVKQVELAVSDNDINVLVLSSILVSDEENIKIIYKFLNTVFAAEERYIRRINKVNQYES